MWNLIFCILKKMEEDSGKTVMYSDTQLENRYRVFRTVALYAMLFGMGLNVSVVGPTLVSMEILLDTDTKSISGTFTSAALGGVIGATICGFLYSRMSQELLFILAGLVLALATCAAPWINNLYYFIAMITISRFGHSLLSTGCQPYLLNLWDGYKIRKPLLQLLHAIWSVGSTTGPFIVRPFLTDIKPITAGDNGYSVNDTFINGTIDYGNYDIMNGTLNITAQEKDLKEKVSLVRYAYITLGSVLIIVTVPMLVLYYLLGPTCKNKSNETITESQEHSSKSVSIFKRKYRIIILIFMSLFYFFYAWVEGLPGFFLAAYVVKGLNWSNVHGSLITSVYWGSHGTGRFLGIPISAALSPQTMLIIDLVVTTSGYLIILLGSFHYSFLWLGTILAGVGQGTVFPTGVLWMEEQIEFTGSASSVLVVACCIGSMTGPLLTGFLFTDFSPRWFTYIVMIGISLVSIIFTGACVFVNRSKKGALHTNLNKESPISHTEMQLFVPSTDDI